MCARIATGDQPRRRAVLSPASVGSRVISLWCQVKAGDHWPTWFGYTQPIANKFRLLSLRVWFDPLRTVVGDQVNYAFFVGTGEPPDPASMYRWNPILPIHHERNITKIWVQTQHSDPQEWSMRTLFEGQALRFGVWLEVSGTVAIVQMFTSFEISEG